MTQKILAVYDDKHILTLIKTVLKKEGYGILTASNGEDGVKKAIKESPDLIILDIVLPTIDGIETCRRLRTKEKTKHIPIIILSAIAVSPEDKIRGLEMGADDYLVKPFHQGELIARVKALLRRVKVDEEPEKVLKTDNITIDLDRHEVMIKNKPVRLTPKEFDLLFILIKKKGKVLSRSFLTERVWGYEYFGTTRTVDMTIGHLREKLGAYSKRIETIEKVGYKFV